MTAKKTDSGRPPDSISELGAKIRTIKFAIAPADIALFKAIVESYDNLATLRTVDPGNHHLMLYFSEEMESEVRDLLDSMRARFSIREIYNSQT